MYTKSAKPLFNPDSILAHVQSGLSATITASLEQGYHDDRDLGFILEQRDKFSKKFTSTSTDHDALSLNAFLLFEEVQCAVRSINSMPLPNPACRVRLDGFSKILCKARSIIARVLGDFDEDEWFRACRHSSGSSVGVPYRDTSPEAKFRGLTATEGVDRWYSYYLKYDGTLSSYYPQGKVKIVRGSYATTVPKDSNKVRMICVEPTLNMFFQQGLMDVITSRLNSVGVSFDVQQDVNRYEAFRSSITGELATIDWSSASDTVAISVVENLFPRKWFYYLNTFRCSEMEILGAYMPLESFSTMGNATTFPVETLVFWAIAQAVTDTSSSNFGPEVFSPRVHVFGDDCILPVDRAPLFIETLSRLGFKPNQEKTFLSGRFRESCGGDFLAGRDVRPFFLTGPAGLSKNHLAAWLNIIVNRLLNRCIRNWGALRYVYIAEPLFRCLFKLYRDYKLELFLVPTDFPDDSGVKLGADLYRFLRLYRIRDLLSKVTVDSHGTKHFRYLRAAYPSRKKTNGNIRCWMALKGLASRAPHQYSVRKDIRYDVAQTVSVSFVVNCDGRH